MDDTIFEKEHLPRHIGIIMDGNGRWAKQRGLPRTSGHAQGAKTFENCVNDCIALGIECVTFYAFSTENWSRPADEVNAIMTLFDAYLNKIRKMSQKNVVLRFIGDVSKLAPSLQGKIAEAEQATANNTGLNCCVAINYGGRDEIVRAVKKIAEQYKNGSVSLDEITEKSFGDYLYTKRLPDVDLIIRPSGELRTSNFLIWQASYAELVFMDVLWPDFTKKDLTDAISQFVKRNRRFGGVQER